MHFQTPITVSGNRVTIAKAREPFRKWQEAIGKARTTITKNIFTLNNFMHDQQVENLSPAAVTEKHVNAFINKPDSPNKVQTRKSNLATLRSFFSFCVAKDWSAGDPSQHVRVDMSILSQDQKGRKKMGVFNVREIQRLVTHFHDQGDVFWEFAVRIGDEIGLGLGDICCLEWNCFKEDGYVVVWTDKRDRQVMVKISQELSELITKVPITDAKYLFPRQRELHQHVVHRAELSTQFKRACDRLNITGRSYKNVRHTCITRWAREGKSLESICKDADCVDEKQFNGSLVKSALLQLQIPSKYIVRQRRPHE